MSVGLELSARGRCTRREMAACTWLLSTGRRIAYTRRWTKETLDRIRSQSRGPGGESCQIRNLAFVSAASIDRYIHCNDQFARHSWSSQPSGQHHFANASRWHACYDGRRSTTYISSVQKLARIKHRPYSNPPKWPYVLSRTKLVCVIPEFFRTFNRR